MDSFAGRTAVITGAGSGIGRALALELARRHCDLAVSDVDLARVGETAARAKALGVDVEAYELDVADRDAVFAHAEEVEQRFATVNLIFNNAGVALAARVAEQTVEQVERVLAVDLHGVIHGTQAFLPKLIASGDGHVVNISSLFGLITVPLNSAYSAAKFGVRGYTEALAIELDVARAPVHVTCVHPGGVSTRIADDSEVAAGNERATRDFNRLLRMSPERAATIILRGVARNRRRQLVGIDAWAGHLTEQLLGSGYQRLFAPVLRRVLERETTSGASGAETRAARSVRGNGSRTARSDRSGSHPSKAS